MPLTNPQRRTFKVTVSFLRGGREQLFETRTADLPKTANEQIAADDRVPQTGFIGPNYEKRRILVVGINPGNGSRDIRSPHDAMMFPALHKFIEAPGDETYAGAIAAQMAAFPCWLASKEIGPILESEGITRNDIAYINASPYRAGSGTARDVFCNNRRRESAARYWVEPMLGALVPSIVIAHGVEAARVLHYADEKLGCLIFNRVRIKAQRDIANARFAENLRDRLAI